MDEAQEPEEVRRLREAVDAFERMENDEECARAVSEVLEEWPELHARLRTIRRDRVKALKSNGLTWKRIGSLLGHKGVSAARAQQIATDQRGEKRPLPSTAKGDSPAT
ncbi:hypothetical protein [Streptomyces sp. WL006]|uniref:hypothetical protein n=1 Tax=Streptomyces sp. WL006 TaxID=3423915 RepID=UPI003F6A8E9B